MNPSSSGSQRNTYQEDRYKFLKMFLLGKDLVGLEIGACDKPTVPPGKGDCAFCDFRSADRMVEMWGLDQNSVCHVDFIVDRAASLSSQIEQRFDYIIACHVIEHVPDPIGYLRDLSEMLRPNGIIFLAVPDKRATNDRNRPLTTIDHLLMDYHNKCAAPSIEHLTEFHRSWLEIQTGAPIPLEQAYGYACEAAQRDDADAHCHVWDDASFFQQFSELSRAGLLGDLELNAAQETKKGVNEFFALFRRT